MTRGMVQLTNKELDVLKNMAQDAGCKNEALLHKLSPENGNSTPESLFDVLISEDEAEIILDCMPIPTEDDDLSLVSARVKVQQFIAQSRFSDQN